MRTWRVRSALLIALAAPGLLPAAASARRIPSYHSPGYVGTKKLPKVAPVAPPRPIWLAADAHSPRVLVDAAGTAHLTWAQDPPQKPGILHYCRLVRGGAGCSATYDRTILQPATGGNGPETDVDFDGPFPLAIGNELLVLDSRCCNNANTPDGHTTGTPNYLFTSEDGGTSFTGPDDPNGSAGIVGTQDPSGGAIVFNGTNPMVGTISDTQTGGTIFQGVPAGQFTREKANLSVLPSRNDAYDGRLAVDGIRPVASFDDLDGNTYVREWNGQGSVNDPANWSLLKVPGAYGSRIAGGASGLLLLSHTSLTGGTLQVRPISRGAASAGRPINLGPNTSAFNVITEAPNGQVAVASTGYDSRSAVVRVHTSADGRRWNDLGAVTRVPNGDLNDLSVGVSVDGGGFVTFRDKSTGTNLFSGRVGAVQFGPSSPTGQPGLGLRAGSSGGPAGDPTASVACTKVHFGAIDALSKAGCFLRDPANPTSGAAVTTGELRLNGLDIVPDAGVKIAIDPRARTINTTGAVSVLLRGSGLGDITLWHGELHVSLAGAGTGTTLFDFDTSQFASALEGFPFSGRIQVKLLPDAVDIPVHVQLPPYFGGVNGDADLRANNADGLVLNSLHLGITDANVGVLELKNVYLDYARAGSVWTGGAEVLLPGPLSPDIKGMVRFEGGSFKYGTLDVGFTPGIPVFEDVYLHAFHLGFGLHPTVFEGGISVGLYDGIGGYPVDIVGLAKIQVGDAANPSIFYIGGTGKILGFGLAHASFTYNSDGYVLFHIDAGVDIDIASLNVSGDVFVVHGAFGANLTVKGCIAGACVGIDAAASPKGLSVCADPVGADIPEWDPSQLTLHFFGCDVSPYRLQAPPAGAAHAAAAGDRTFLVTRGQHAVDLQLPGAGGPPTVDLVAPDGKVVTPVAPTVRGATVLGVASRSRAETFIGLLHPAAGTWTVRARPGSFPIASLMVAHSLVPPSVLGTVAGNGAVRTFHYLIHGATNGTVVRFAEASAAGRRYLATAKGTRGAVRFSPTPGRGGLRTVVAVVTQDGYTRAQPRVAYFRVAPLRRPAKVARLRISRQGASVHITFSPAADAYRYAVLVKATGGLATQRTISRTSLTLRGVRPDSAITVVVRGINVRGVKGPAAAKSLAVPRRRGRR